jgi:hypothetical protein
MFGRGCHPQTSPLFLSQHIRDLLDLIPDIVDGENSAEKNMFFSAELGSLCLKTILFHQASVIPQNLSTTLYVFSST